MKTVTPKRFKQIVQEAVSGEGLRPVVEESTIFRDGKHYKHVRVTLFDGNRTQITVEFSEGSADGRAKADDRYGGLSWSISDLYYLGKACRLAAEILNEVARIKGSG